jgi:hypothetical protein
VRDPACARQDEVPAAAIFRLVEPAGEREARHHTRNRRYVVPEVETLSIFAKGVAERGILPTEDRATTETPTGRRRGRRLGDDLLDEIDML